MVKKKNRGAKLLGKTCLLMADRTKDVGLSLCCSKINALSHTINTPLCQLEIILPIQS